MKIVSLSSLAFACLCFFSCTKEASQLKEQDDQSTHSAARASILGNGQAVGNTAVEPELTVVYNPSPGTVNQPVLVTGTFTSTTGETLPACGKLQLFQKIDGQWQSVTQEKDISASVQEVNFSFVPTIVGIDAYEFKVNYVSQNCGNFTNTRSASFPLTVISDCQGLSLKGSVTGAQQAAEAGLFEFTVTYVVDACGVDFEKLKLQGGLTNATEIVTSGTSGPGEYSTWISGGSTNHIQKWEESTPGSSLSTAKRTYVTTFKRPYTGAGPVELTGDWSVSLWLNGTDAGHVEFPKVIYQP